MNIFPENFADDDKKSEALDKLNQLLSTSRGGEILLHDQIVKDITGQIEGTEGKWKFTYSATETPTAIITKVDLGTVQTELYDTSVSNDKVYFGATSRIVVDGYGIITGNSGNKYICTFCNGVEDGSKIRSLRLDPYHGDVRTDFTIGSNYKVLIFEESTTIEDQKIGMRDIEEYLPSTWSFENFETILPIGSYGTMNVGYKEGIVWKSQLLKDVEILNGVLLPKLNKKIIKNDDVKKIEVRKKDGTWFQYSINYQENTQFGAAVHYPSNTVKINIEQSYIALGYTSLTDFITNSLIRITYQTKSRVWRPVESPRNFLAISQKVYLLCTNNIETGVYMMGDLINNVPISTTSLNINWTILKKGADIFRINPSGVGPIGWQDYEAQTPRYIDTQSVVFMYGLYEDGDKLYMCVIFKELIYNGTDWGDNSRFMINDNLVTTTDEEGNTILTGSMAHVIDI